MDKKINALRKSVAKDAKKEGGKLEELASADKKRDSLVKKGKMAKKKGC